MQTIKKLHLPHFGETVTAHTEKHIPRFGEHLQDIAMTIAAIILHREVMRTATVSQIHAFFRGIVESMARLETIRTEIAEYELQVRSAPIARGGEARSPLRGKDTFERRVLRLEYMREEERELKRITAPEKAERVISLLDGGCCYHSDDMARLLRYLYVERLSLIAATENLYGVIRESPAFSSYLRKASRMKHRAFEVLAELCPDEYLWEGGK